MLVLNPNRGTRSEAHVIAAWAECVEPAAAAHVVMVAHSYGGVCVGELLAARGDAVTARLRGVALTDSVHGRSVERLPAAQREFWVAHCVNWVTSKDPLDAPVRAAVHSPPSEDELSEEDDTDDRPAPLRCVCMPRVLSRLFADRQTNAESARLARFGRRFGATLSACPLDTPCTSRRARHAARARAPSCCASCWTRAGRRPRPL